MSSVGMETAQFEVMSSALDGFQGNSQEPVLVKFLDICLKMTTEILRATFPLPCER